jgi:hypothetical protein
MITVFHDLSGVAPELVETNLSVAPPGAEAPG